MQKDPRNATGRTVGEIDYIDGRYRQVIVGVRTIKRRGYPDEYETCLRWEVLRGRTARQAHSSLKIAQP